MGVSIQEVIESGGYDLSTREDAEWLLGQVNQFEELVIEAEDLIERLDEQEDE